MFFSDIKEAPPDAILDLKWAYLADPRPNKVDLGVGIYKTENLRSLMMASVKEAEKIVFSKETVADYLPIDGDHQYLEAVGNLVFDGVYSSIKDRLSSSQAVGGTGGLRIGAEALAFIGIKKIYMSDPTWANHPHIFQRAGLHVERYPYYSKEKKGLDFPKMRDFLDKLEERSAILFHASCHNPTGCDPTLKQWEELAELCKRKKHLAFLDLSYQGLGDGVKEDAASIRTFAKVNPEMMVVTTFAKNFSLYSQRTAAFFLLLEDAEQKKAVHSQIRRIIRGLYSNPPSHGSWIVKEILTNPTLKEHWLREVEGMRHRLSEMRKELVRLLTAKPANVDYHFLKEHKGMFSFCNLPKASVDRLKKEFAIYLPDDGRINMAGLNRDNIQYVADAILEVS